MKSDLVEEERISIKEAVLRLEDWVRSMFRSWKVILLGAFGFGLLYVGYQAIRKPVYTARTTFVLESGSGGGAGGISSLASAVGISLGDFSGENELFNADNILELYRSYRMLKETFLAEREIEGQTKRLITHLCEENGMLEKWNRSKALADLTFELPVEDMEVVHDSLLMEVIDDFRKKNLVVDKVDRRLSLLQVKISGKNQLFAKAYNEELVKNVNQFYLQTKTKKTAANLTILQSQADSVKGQLDNALRLYAEATEKAPNPNPVLTTNLIRYEKLKIDIQTSSVVYEEMLRQVELAKITHLENIPLIQIVDSPILPLENDKDRLIKSIVIGLFIGGFLMVFALTFRRIYRAMMQTS